VAWKPLIVATGRCNLNLTAAAASDFSSGLKQMAGLFQKRITAIAFQIIKTDNIASIYSNLRF